MFVELPQSAKLTAPSRREPCLKLNGGDRKASLLEVGGKSNGLDGGSECLSVSSAVDFMFVVLPQSQPTVSTAQRARPPLST